MFMNWKNLDNTQQTPIPFEATDVSLGFLNVLAVDTDGKIWSYTVGEKDSWIDTGKTGSKVVALLTGEMIWIDDAGLVWTDFGGSDLELGDGMECALDIASSFSMEIYMVACDGSLK